VHFIFMGTHAADGLGDLFSASHTWEVIRKAPCPVLVIPPDGFFTGIKQITYATEYREEELPVIRFVAKLAECFGAGLTVLHIGNYGFSKPIETLMFETFRKELWQKLSSKKPDIRLLQGEDLVSALNEFCIRTETDWLAISQSKPDLLDQIFDPGPNLSQKLSLQTRLPLLAIPENYSWEEKGNWELAGAFHRK
jgi:hypothetical protein